MTKTLNTKQGSEWTNDDGHTFPAAPLYRFTDENGDGPGVWYGSVERADASWARWIAGAPLRAKRRTMAADVERRVAEAQAARRDASDPFAVFDR